MDFQEIQDKLNALFSGDERRIVFWCDDDASYAEEVDHFELAEGSRLFKLTGGGTPSLQSF